MTEPIDLPPELQHVANRLAEQPPAVREIFRYALVLAMIDDEKAWVTGTRLIEDREYLTIRAVAGDVLRGGCPMLRSAEWSVSPNSGCGRLDAE